MVQYKLVSFETAKKLKRIGFPQSFNIREQFYYVTKNTEESDYDEIGKLVSDRDTEDSFCKKRYRLRGYINAPTLSIVHNWIEEEKHIYINVDARPNLGGECAGYSVNVILDKDDFANGYQVLYKTRDEALETGINEALKHIKNE